jgi:protein JSN1
MSLSAPDTSVSYPRAPPPGKTPPPAPSAAFAKRYSSVVSCTAFLLTSFIRAREAEERMGGRYRPPALRALASGGSPPNDLPTSVTSPADASALPPTNHPPGFRRARAGTLPSNVQLAAQRFAAASNTLGSTPASTDHLPEEPAQRQIPGTATPSPGLAAPTRPGLRHATSVASSAAPAAVTERNSRLRSGSLTLPTGGLSNAFGPSIFSSSWLSTVNGGGNGFQTLDELRSVTSADSGADDFDVHTLDYLGLDDHRNDNRNDPRQHPQAATLSELRNQAQAAIAGNLANPSRLRASTVSNPYRSRPVHAGSSLSTPAAEEEEEYFEDYDVDLAYTRQRLNSYETSIPDGGYPSAYVAKGFKATDHLSATRPRAISVSGLDEPLRSLPRRSTVADVHPYVNELNQPSSGLSVLASNVGGPASILKSLASSRGSSSPNVHFPSGEGTGRGVSQYLLAPSSQNRSLSPKSEGPSSQTQTPTRSLWIGNLDSAVTSEQLIHVFAPYGAIESLRLLPEKVCFPGKLEFTCSVFLPGMWLCKFC